MTEPGIMIPFFKGRVALHAILMAAGIGPGDQVLLPGYTCVVVPNAINYTGAKPVYLDIEARNFNLDCDRLEEGIGRQWSPERAKALIAQHTYGIPADMDRLMDFARKHNLLLIEDSCHAIGARWSDREVGSLGDAAFFSSQWSKPVTTGLGGWARINNLELAKAFSGIKERYTQPSMMVALVLEMQHLAFTALNRPRLYGSIQSIYRRLGQLGLALGSSSSAELACELPSEYGKGMHPLQLRRLKNLLSQVASMVRTRQERAKTIEDALAGAGMPTIKTSSACIPVYLRYPLLIRNKEQVLAAARREKIHLGDWFLSPIHPNLESWELAGYSAGTCPVGEDVSRRVINISTDARMSEAEVRRTVSFLANHATFD